MSAKQPKIIVVGAGPTGLGAAVRLTELQYPNWHLYDCGEMPGGLSRSHKDAHGFTWDMGGHVIFSHYQYFDDVMNLSVQHWNTLQRESWVRVAGCWVPYPFQNNIHRLPDKLRDKCLDGLIAAMEARGQQQHSVRKPNNFEESFTAQFGEGICHLFMRPYNFKVWGVSPSTMSTEWVGERVAQVDVERVKRNIELQRDDVGWGPNAKFRFPQHGGTGAIYRSITDKLPSERVTIGAAARVVAVDAYAKTVRLEGGETVEYDVLISTMPLDGLLRMLSDGLEGSAAAQSGVPTSSLKPRRLREVANGLIYSSTHIIGLGIRGTPPPHLKTACWLYFPEDNAPFYRCTVFSNYAESNAPAECWSLMLEVSENSVHKPVDASRVVADCVQGCIATTLLTEQDEIVSRWHHVERKGYPIPFVGRNALLEEVLPALRDDLCIYSRGRFGAWKYEVANQDHSMMQGVEAVNHYLSAIGSLADAGGISVEEETLHYPERVNTKRGEARCSLLQQA